MEKVEEIYSRKAYASSIISVGAVFLFVLFVAISRLSWGIIAFNIIFWVIIAAHGFAIILAALGIIDIKRNRRKGNFFAFSSIINSVAFIFVAFSLLKYLFFVKF